MRRQTVGSFYSSQFSPLVFIPLWIGHINSQISLPKSFFLFSYVNPIKIAGLFQAKKDFHIFLGGHHINQNMIQPIDIKFLKQVFTLFKPLKIRSGRAFEAEIILINPKALSHCTTILSRRGEEEEDWHSTTK